MKALKKKNAGRSGKKLWGSDISVEVIPKGRCSTVVKREGKGS